MPRIIVTTDSPSPELREHASVLLDEHVHSVHLSTDHAASQLVQRLAWAVGDAESAERQNHLPALPQDSQPRPRERPVRRPTRAGTPSGSTRGGAGGAARGGRARRTLAA
jgi:hypothetical protein